MPNVDIGAVTGTGSPKAAAAGADFLNRVSHVIKEFRGLIEFASTLQGKSQSTAPKIDYGGPDNVPRNEGQTITLLVKSLIAAGYGDRPLGELLKDIYPHSLNDIIKMAKNVRLEK